MTPLDDTSQQDHPPITTEHLIELAKNRAVEELRRTRRWVIATFIAVATLIATVAAGAASWMSSREFYRQTKQDARLRSTPNFLAPAPAVPQLMLEQPEDAILEEAGSARYRIRINDENVTYQIDAAGGDDLDPVIDLYRITANTRPSLLASNDDRDLGTRDSRLLVMLQDSLEYELRVQEFQGRAGTIRVSIAKTQPSSR